MSNTFEEIVDAIKANENKVILDSSGIALDKEMVAAAGKLILGERRVPVVFFKDKPFQSLSEVYLDIDNVPHMSLIPAGSMFNLKKHDMNLKDGIDNFIEKERLESDVVYFE